MLNLKVQQQQQQLQESSNNVVINLKKPAVAINNNNNNTPVLPPKDNFFKLPVVVEGSEGSDNIALFTRKEIEIGALVGSGSFSEVFEINGFVNEKQQRKKLNLLLPRRTKSSSSNDDETSRTMMEPSRRRKRNELIEEHNQHKQDMYSGKAIKSKFVIKHLHQKLLSDPKLYRRALKDLATEVSIMSAIEHPHIVQLHGTALGGVNNATIQTDNNDDPVGAASTANHDGYFLILDRLQQTLDDRIESWNQEKIRIGPTYYLDAAANDAKMALKANYALQIASALNYLHERRIVFRDLKPQNIGFKEVHPDHPERDVLALFDFGLSRTLPSSSNKANEDGLYKMSMVGTRRYMAPEVVTTRTYDARADTYSWSLVFYELVTQCRPYDGIQRAEHKQFVCQEGKRPKIYDYYGLPAELERLMRYSWAQDISKRLTMDEVCSILQQYLVGTIHEDCVRPLPEQASTANNNNNSMIHDDSISSLISNGTQNTEQTQSTTNSFTLDNHDDDDDNKNNHATTNAATSSPTTSTSEPTAGASTTTTGIVPDAILAVGSITAASSHASDIDHEPEDDDLRTRRRHSGRRVSLCERCVDLFRHFRSGNPSSNN